MDADEPEGGRDVGRAEFLLDDVQGPQGDLFRAVELGARRRPQAHLQLTVVGGREDLASELRADAYDEEHGERHGGDDDQGPAGHDALEDGFVARLDAGEEARGVHAFVLEQPDRQDGKEGGGQRIRGEHAEADR